MSKKPDHWRRRRLRLNPVFAEISGKRLAAAARELAPYARPVWRELVLAFTCSVGGVLMGIARPWPIKMVLDYAILPAGRVKWVFPYALMKGYGAMGVTSIACGLLLAVTLLGGFFAYNQRYFLAAAGQRVTMALRRRLFSHLQGLALSFHRRQRVGDLLLRATGDTNMLREMLVDAILVIVREFFVVVAMVGVMFWLDWQLTLVSLAVLPLLSVAVFQIAHSLRSAVRKQRKREGRVAALFGEMLQGIAVIQAFGRERHEQERFQELNRQNFRRGLRTARLEANLERIAEGLIAVGTAGVLWFGVSRVLSGILTPGDLVVFTSYLGAMYRPLRRIARVTGRLSKATVCADRVFSVLRTEERVKIRRDAAVAPRFRGRVNFKHVTFAFRVGEVVFRDVSFVVRPGQSVAIVGPNGAGKSTLCGLLPRLFDPVAGTITIDGEKINRFTLDSLREQIGVVLQEPLLFAGTVRENIAYGKPEAMHEEVAAAARLADADEFIRSLRKGYDTAVGERGETLSAGQRQKIAIARAMIKDPVILILDEPSASLDPASALQLNAMLARLARGRTTFRVSHRICEARRADLILVVHRGRAAAFGSHEEARSGSAWYREMDDIQRQEEVAAPAGEGEDRAKCLA